MKRILVTTGGTGGHVIPAKIILDHLSEKNETFLTTDIRGLKYLGLDKSELKIINTPKLNIDFLIPFKILNLIYLVFQSLLYLKEKN